MSALKFVSLTTAVQMFPGPTGDFLLQGVSLKNMKKTKHTSRNPTTSNQFRMDLHVDGAHTGQNRLLVAGREGEDGASDRH